MFQKSKIRSRVTGGAAALALLTLFVGGAALAEEDRNEAFYKKEIAAWSGKIAKLTEADADKRATAEVERIRSDIGQAQAFLAADKLEEIDPLLVRSKALLALSYARVGRGHADMKAADAAARLKKEIAMNTSAQKHLVQTKTQALKLEETGL